MTWHQWHHTASRSSRTNRFCCLAWVKTASDQGCQASLATFAAVGGAWAGLADESCAEAGGRTSRNDTRTANRGFMASSGSTEEPIARMPGSLVNIMQPTLGIFS